MRRHGGRSLRLQPSQVLPYLPRRSLGRNPSARQIAASTSRSLPAAALHLRQIGHRHLRGISDLAQRALLLPGPTQRCPDEVS